MKSASSILAALLLTTLSARYSFADPSPDVPPAVPLQAGQAAPTDGVFLTVTNAAKYAGSITACQDSNAALSAALKDSAPNAGYTLTAVVVTGAIAAVAGIALGVFVEAKVK